MTTQVQLLRLKWCEVNLDLFLNKKMLEGTEMFLGLFYQASYTRFQQRKISLLGNGKDATMHFYQENCNSDAFSCIVYRELTYFAGHAWHRRHHQLTVLLGKQFPVLASAAVVHTQVR